MLFSTKINAKILTFFQQKNKKNSFDNVEGIYLTSYPQILLFCADSSDYGSLIKTSVLAARICDGGFSGQFCRIFEIISFGFVVAICDLVHDVEAINHLP